MTFGWRTGKARVAGQPILVVTAHISIDSGHSNQPSVLVTRSRSKSPRNEGISY